MGEFRMSYALKWSLHITSVALFAGSLLLSADLSVRAQSDALMTEIEGTVLNGTVDGEPPDELTVFVLVIDEVEEEIVERVETLTEADGSFSLEVTTISEGRFYRVVVEDGVYTPYVDVLPENADEEVLLTIYDRTTSLDDISVASYSMVLPVVDTSTGVIGVLAAVNLVNSGDEVYLPDLTDPNLTGFNLLRFNLPVGYQELIVESDLPSGNVMEIGTGFAISNPVPPGEYSIVISYSFPFEGDELRYPMRLPFGAESVSIMLPEDSGKVTGLGLNRTETVNIGDGRYIRYDGWNYERSSELGVVISGLPSPDIQSQLINFIDSIQFRISIVVSVALALIGIIAYTLLIVRRRQSVVTVESPGVASDIDGERTSIIQAIADLDEMRELGKMQESEYLVRRQRLVRQAIDADIDL